ncbi:hypothetical protein EEL52_01675 [Muribaculaceae bacterium Isolate-113 (HZI)]|nr:hypothetical protein EEL53_02735 [Muribaculaceae bacterium Isolate-114 (HZI)]ROT24903.1 hypothetical protein EEL52_01675 [Muribaculaceae bacterium Isolate-113 (HZI)]RXE68456.1 hypothetical protein ED328_06555 [Muribaculaceae bacterium Isolate-001 (NCI)]GFI38633.1 hypothetical protein IMSAGC016_00398 [Muribaculaceae bacterium]
MAEKKVYFNKPQRLTQLIGANTTVIVAGRRTGKTDSIAAPFVLRNMQRMPGSTGGIVVPTFKHGLTNTIPGLLAAWKRWGFIEGIHYVVGRKPPKSFRQPIIDPKDYEHVISFYNGSVAVIISQDRPGSSNSLTLSWLLVDEAKFIDYAKLKDETLPANGGIKSYFGKHSFNHSIMILSDMPQTQKGSWFLHYRDKMDPELIATIEVTVYEIWRTKERIRALNASGKPVPPYLKGYLRRLDRDLNKMRSVAVYYREYSSIENLQLLGENYIKQMKRDLTPLTFQTSILCQRIGIAKDGFYSSMREGHKYDANDNQYLDTLGYDYDFSTLDSRADKDVDPDAPICIGMDYNANINWIVAGQPRDRRLNVIKSFYVKFERKIPALVEDFCRYYAEHRNKTVVYYYDATALGSNYAVNDQDFHYNVVKEFERHGWRVESVYLGNPMHHDEKYLLINNAFAGKQRLMPFFNRSNNEDLILAVQSAGVSRGRNGFHKDKSGEKLAESEEDLLEHRTDCTDAFDTLYIGCEKFPFHDAFALSVSGVS